MTDEELIEKLPLLINPANIPGWHDRQFLIGHAIERLRSKSVPAPHSPGSVPVRIAVALGDGSRSACVVDEHNDDGEKAMDAARSTCLEYCQKVLAEAIITAHIPSRVVPEVVGTVTAFDPEATA